MCLRWPTRFGPARCQATRFTDAESQEHTHLREGQTFGVISAAAHSALCTRTRAASSLFAGRAHMLQNHPRQYKVHTR
eukprot:6185413-Pleurochrysis_carterae.AAC.3